MVPWPALIANGVMSAKDLKKTHTPQVMSNGVGNNSDNSVVQNSYNSSDTINKMDDLSPIGSTGGAGCKNKSATAEQQESATNGPNLVNGKTGIFYDNRQNVGQVKKTVIRGGCAPANQQRGKNSSRSGTASPVTSSQPPAYYSTTTTAGMHDYSTTRLPQESPILEKFAVNYGGSAGYFGPVPVSVPQSFGAPPNKRARLTNQSPAAVAGQQRLLLNSAISAPPQLPVANPRVFRNNVTPSRIYGQAPTAQLRQPRGWPQQPQVAVDGPETPTVTAPTNTFVGSLFAPPQTAKPPSARGRGGKKAPTVQTAGRIPPYVGISAYQNRQAQLYRQQSGMPASVSSRYSSSYPTTASFMDSQRAKNNRPETANFPGFMPMKSPATREGAAIASRSLSTGSSVPTVSDSRFAEPRTHFNQQKQSTDQRKQSKVSEQKGNSGETGSKFSAPASLGRSNSGLLGLMGGVDGPSTSTDRRASRKSSISSTGSSIRVQATPVSTMSAVDLLQVRLEKKAEMILRRIKKLQAQQTELHCAEQIRAFSGECRVQAKPADGKQIKKTKQEVDRECLILEKKLSRVLEDPEFKKLIQKKDELKNKSAAELARLIKKHEGKNMQDLIGGAANTTTGKTVVTPKVPKTEQLRILVDVLLTHMKGLKSGYDSEATESSSGGESCDEIDGELDKTGIARNSNKNKRRVEAQQRKFPTVTERSQWAYHSERSWLGSRWGWLQSHIADLEYKIRQHVDICRQLRARKCPVFLGPIAKDKETKQDVDSCARIRPVCLTKRRNLVRTTGMFRWNRKAARLSSSHCGCFPPVDPCVMCSGRLNNIQNHPDVCSQGKRERVGILDQAFHPVLSHRNMIGLDKRVQALLKQQACLTMSPQKKNGSGLKKNQLNQKRMAGSGHLGPGKTGKLKIKLGGSLSKHQKRGRPLKSVRDRHKEHSGNKRSKKKPQGSKSSGSRPSTPLSPSLSIKTERTYGSGQSSPAKPLGKLAGKLGNQRRSTITASTYDIDNIVIDPSAVAMAKVEKLQYKEIITPGWRLNSVDSKMDTIEEEDETEDLAEETFDQRHWQKESEEKKRFQAYKACIWTPQSFFGKRRPSQPAATAPTTSSTETPPTPSQAPPGPGRPSVHNLPPQSELMDLSELPSGSEKSPSPYPVRDFPLPHEGLAERPPD